MQLLAVPVHVDALWLSTDRDVAGPAADFTRLPYVDTLTGRDVGGDRPYLSDLIVSAPFAQDLRLRAGLHLHWALPDALTALTHGAGEVRVPRVPNRWLVTRVAAGVVDGRWVVDSDALTDDDRAGTPYPVSGDVPSAPNGRPWRRLGRTLPLDFWPGAPADRLPALTALGYGEPTFAAFYPNAHGVFGFHDAAQTAAPPVDTSYDVIGWYADGAGDELLARLAAAEADVPWTDTLAADLGWSAPGVDDAAAAPDGMICFGRLSFPADAVPAPPPADDDALESGVWLADTATEALASHLGAVLPDVTPAGMERLLEALTAADELENATLDLPIRLAEARHTATFGTVQGTPLWSVRSTDPSNEAALPKTASDLLAGLNAIQADYDRAQRLIVARRTQLFADWHRYQACAYPPQDGRADYPEPDLVEVFLRQRIMELDRLVAVTGTVPPVGPGDTVAHRLAAAQQAVLDAIQDTGHALQPVPDAPFAVPNEPVVLVTGPAATPSDRHGADGATTVDGLLPGYLFDAGPIDADTRAGATRLADLVAALTTKLGAASAASGRPQPGLRVWTGQPWHPLLLHWEVEFLPIDAGNNIDPADPGYDPGFVVDNYRIAPGDAELLPRPGRDRVEQAANVYAGSTVLSAATRPVLSARILRYLLTSPLTAYNGTHPPLTPEQVAADPEVLLDWCAGQHDDPRLKLLAAAYRHLLVHEDSNLAQSLGGFNDALVMQRLVRQLPIADPLGFPAGQRLASAVAAAVAGQGRRTPVPMSDLNPIRAGAVRLLRLRIVDTFGIGFDVDVANVGTSERLTGGGGRVTMPPRLAQPARVNLRLLDDRACGWLLPDDLDDGLRAFDADGGWLGTLYALADPAAPQRALWRPAPGGVPLDGIGEPRLRAALTRLQGYGGAGVGTFLAGLDEALDAVQPEDATQHRGRAALLGRPVAVVGVSIGLQTHAPPPIHQDWNLFRLDLRRARRETDGLAGVLFPVRVGESGRYGDGVLGYWVEDGTGAIGDTYRNAADDADGLRLCLDAPEQVLTVLLEPAGLLHATTGILPTVSVALTDEHHQQTLSKLETGFLAAPVLTGAAGVALPTSPEPGRVWVWREADGDGWVETADPPAPADGFPDGLTVREGWLELRTS